MTTPEFDTALRQSARAMTRTYPEEQARIDRGLVLALNGAAVYVEDHWQVRSASDAEVVYAIQPEGCECPDRQRAPESRCKHYWCVYLTYTAELRTVPGKEEGVTHVED